MVRPRRAAALVLGAVAVLPLVALLSSCGSSNADIHATVTSDAALDKVRPGDLVPFTVTVGNHGPGAASSVTVRVDLPGGFRYQSTTGIDGTGGATRTQPSDPPVNSVSPLWGQWSMNQPGVNADGTPARAVLKIDFLAKAGGSPGDYTVVPHVFSEGNDEVVGQAAKVTLLASSDLTMTVAVDESTVKRGDLVHYHVSILNRGSGPAQGVGVLVTLPGGLVFNRTEHLEGNYSRSGPVDPISGALIVYYGGWTLPPSSASRPGALTIVFSAKVLPTALGGRYAVTAQLTDSGGGVISLGDTAPVTVNAPTPTPVPPSPSGRATATPRSTPAPTPTRKP
jgi:uncharacterized repeat protein (TIGR01451 family)